MSPPASDEDAFCRLNLNDDEKREIDAGKSAEKSSSDSALRINTREADVSLPWLDCANFYKLSNFDCSTSNSISSVNMVLDNSYDCSDYYDSQPATSTSTMSDVAIEMRASAGDVASAKCANQKRLTDESKKLKKSFYRQSLNKKNECRDAELQCLGWQAKASTIRDRTAHMLLNSHLADVLFVVGNPAETKVQRFPAHKFVLAIGSAVFDAMFHYDVVNKLAHDSTQAQEISIIDVEPKAFIALLRFLYKDEVSLTSDSVMATLYAAKKYGVPSLEYECIAYLKDRLSAENAFLLLAQSRFFDEHAFAEACMELIGRDTADALQAEGFLDIDHATLCAVLQRDTLCIDELALFQAVMRWAVEECKRQNLPLNVDNQRIVLGRALYLIRYTEMTITEFAENVAMSGLLTSENLVGIFLHFTIGSPPPVSFLTTQRRRFGKQMFVNRFQRVEASWGYSGTPDRIKFVVDAGIWLLGFGLYGSINDAAVYNVTIEVINSGSGVVLARCQTSFQSDGTTSIFPVMFDNPVDIAPSVTYVASAKLIGEESHYGSKGLRRIVRQISTPLRTSYSPAVPTTSLSSLTVIPTDSRNRNDINEKASNNNSSANEYDSKTTTTKTTTVNSRNMTAPSKTYGAVISSSASGSSGNNNNGKNANTINNNNSGSNNNSSDGNNNGCITFHFSFAPGDNNGTSVDDGQIPQLIFCEKY